MKKILILFILIMNIIGEIEAHSIEEIRKHYKLAVNDASVANKLADKLKKVNQPDALTLAYQASVEALKAKHAWSPYTKLQQMNAYEKLMNEAIKMKPDDLEIRFLRYSIQLNTPLFLGYSNNLTEDKQAIVNLFLKKKFNTKDKKLIKEVFDFMLNANTLSTQERLKMEEVLKSI